MKSTTAQETERAGAREGWGSWVVPVLHIPPGKKHSQAQAVHPGRLPQGFSAGSQALRKIFTWLFCFVFTPLTPPRPPKYFSWSCSNTNFLHKILLAWRGSKQFPWLVPKTCFAVSCLLVLLFYQVPPNSQIPLLPEQQVTPVGKILLNLCFPVWRSCRNCWGIRCGSLLATSMQMAT